jgi:hypothetical protein
MIDFLFLLMQYIQDTLQSLPEPLFGPYKFLLEIQGIVS